jgi:hypothetical protein
MRGPFADFSPAVPAAFAAGLGISLWIFLLPGGVVEKGPTPVLPALGGAAGRVAADLPVPARHRVLKVRTAVFSAHPQLVVTLQPPTAKKRPVHHPARTAMVRRASSPPVGEVQDTRSQLFSIPPTAKGKARGNARGHARKPEAETPTPGAPGRGKAVGRSNEDEDRLPPGLAKKASPASATRLSPRSEGNGGGKGHKGRAGGNRGKGNDGRNRGEGNGGGKGDGGGRKGKEN